MKKIKLELVMEVPDDFYAPAFIGGIQGYYKTITVVEATEEVYSSNH